MFRIFFITSLLFSSLFSKTYERIDFSGLVHLSQFSAKEILGFDKDSDVDEEMIDASIKRFFSQGYFVDIKVEEIDNALVYTFKEKPLISKIVLNGINESDKDEKYMPILGIKKGDIFDEAKIEKAKRAIINLMRAEGFYSTVVEYTPNIQESDVEVVFTINKGKRILIYESIFDGAKSFSKSELDDTLANKELEIFPWFFGQNDGKLNLLMLEHDDERLKDFYMSNGYLDSVVEEPFLKADFNNFSAKLYYKIFEGMPYTITGIDIEILDSKDINLKEVQENLIQKTGKVFDIQKIRKDLTSIKDEVGSAGYAFARVFPDIKKDKKSHTAKIIYKVLAGEKVYIRDVIISGNNRTLDRVVRREVFLAPGELYNLKEIKDSKAALGRLGYFEKAELKERRVNANTMDLLIEVQEASTGTLQAGGGWNSSSGFTFSTSISDRNIFGSSIAFDLSAEKSDDTRSFSFSLTNPRLDDGDYSLSGSLYSTFEETDDYRTDTDGVSLTTGKRLDKFWSFSTGVSYSESDNRYYDLDAIHEEFYIEGLTTKIALSPYVKFNNTDDFFIPRRGIDFSSSIEAAGFGADQEFVKSVSKFTTYYGLQELIDFDIVLRYKAKLALLDGEIDDSKKIPLGSRLYLGGLGTVRGFKRNSISPLDTSTYDTSGDEDDIIRIGANRSFSNSIEASFPLLPSAKMRFLTFVDAGWTGRDDFSISRSSYGTAIEWFSPMGPIMFIWAWPVDEEKLDDTSVFEFTLGQKF